MSQSNNFRVSLKTNKWQKSLAKKEDDNFLILTKEESQERINLLLIISSFVFSTAVIGYATAIAILTIERKPRIVEPFISTQKGNFG